MRQPGFTCLFPLVVMFPCTGCLISSNLSVLFSRKKYDTCILYEILMRWQSGKWFLTLEKWWKLHWGGDILGLNWAVFARWSGRGVPQSCKRKCMLEWDRLEHKYLQLWVVIKAWEWANNPSIPFPLPQEKGILSRRTLV